ncbi:MAG: diaminopimelate epimerase [Candidatus Omnitrophica bacterium]|nr:diaminopimelate epimerase [Candidatus Omnitrophota bacterium]
MRFTKMVAAGNDFIVVDNRAGSQAARNWAGPAKVLCGRKTGIGADGLLVLEKSKKADFKMSIINADGSEAEMCGNGLRCAAMYAGKRKKDLKIETLAGIYEAKITGSQQVRIKMENPKALRLNVTIAVNGREMEVGYIDSGVPHAIIFAQGLEAIDVDSIGRSVRHHAEFGRRGTNVDFVEIIDDKTINMRTYERGVEGETLACGTGAVASAIITRHASRVTRHAINVHTKGGILKVYFKNKDGEITDVYLEGEAKKVYAGEVDYV